MNTMTTLGQERTSNIKMYEKHVGTNLCFEKRKSVSGGDRIYMGQRIERLSGLKEIQPITSIGLSKNELGSFIKFLKRVTTKLEAIKDEK